MNKIIFIIFIFYGCSINYYTPDSISLNYHTGSDTKLISTGLGTDDHTGIHGVDISFSRKESFIRYGLESSLTSHTYNESFDGKMIDGELFIQLEKSFENSWFIYAGFGIGIGKFIETNGEHPLIYQDEIIGVLDFRAGVRKEYESMFYCLEYRMDHYSGIPAGDKGTNDDSISIHFGIKF